MSVVSPLWNPNDTNAVWTDVSSNGVWNTPSTFGPLQKKKDITALKQPKSLPIKTEVPLSGPASSQSLFFYEVESNATHQNAWDTFVVPPQGSPSSNPQPQSPRSFEAISQSPTKRTPNNNRLVKNEEIEEEIAQQNRYKTELCKSWLTTGNCKYCQKCQFAHGEDELRPVLRHPKYKTEICRSYSSTGTCPYGNRCRFIHSDVERRAVVPGSVQEKESFLDFTAQFGSLSIAEENINSTVQEKEKKVSEEEPKKKSFFKSFSKSKRHN